MENKYEVIAEERLNNTTRLFTIVDFKTKNDYSCIIDEEEPNNVKILVDDLANSYDVGEALFKHDINLFNILPKYMKTPNMIQEYNSEYNEKEHSPLINKEDFDLLYKEEEQRIQLLRKNEKKLVK